MESEVADPVQWRSGIKGLAGRQWENSGAGNKKVAIHIDVWAGYSIMQTLVPRLAEFGPVLPVPVSPA